jgi:hypothetical protein
MVVPEVGSGSPIHFSAIRCRAVIECRPNPTDHDTAHLCAPIRIAGISTGWTNERNRERKVLLIGQPSLTNRSGTAGWEHLHDIIASTVIREGAGSPARRDGKLEGKTAIFIHVPAPGRCRSYSTIKSSLKPHWRLPALHRSLWANYRAGEPRRW